MILNPIPEKEQSLALSDDHSETDISPAAKLTIFEQLNYWMHRNHLFLDSPHASVELPIDGPLKKQIRFLHPFPAFLPSARALGFNNSSIVLRVGAAGASALLTGDIEPDGWRLLKRNSGAVRFARANVLKFPHHGAWKKSSGLPANAHAFLDEVGAKTVVMSVGTEQKGYNHPDPHVFKAIRDKGIHVLCTQATKKCGGVGVLKLRIKTEGELTSQSNSVGRPSCLSKHGCPCAGSIVIDLNASVRIVQPNGFKHRDEIVRKVFSKRHQCPV